MKRAVTVLLTLFLAGLLQRARAGHSARAGQGGRPIARGGRRVLDGGAHARGDAGRARQGRGGKGPKASYPFTRYEPATYNPAHGKVFFTDSGVNYVCSGTALTSGNKSVVWTAGHCVNEGPGAYYTNWAFVPAYKDGARPYGTWAARDAAARPRRGATAATSATTRARRS